MSTGFENPSNNIFTGEDKLQQPQDTYAVIYAVAGSVANAVNSGEQYTNSAELPITVTVEEVLQRTDCRYEDDKTFLDVLNTERSGVVLVDNQAFEVLNKHFKKAPVGYKYVDFDESLRKIEEKSINNSGDPTIELKNEISDNYLSLGGLTLVFVNNNFLQAGWYKTLIQDSQRLLTTNCRLFIIINNTEEEFRETGNGKGKVRSVYSGGLSNFHPQQISKSEE